MAKGYKLVITHFVELLANYNYSASASQQPLKVAYNNYMKLITAFKLTVKRCHCVHITPLSISSSRHSSHSNIVCSARKKCIHFIQYGSGNRRCYSDLIIPPSSLIPFVPHLVPRDVYITLGSIPSHPQNWFPFSHVLGYSNIGNSGRD